MNSTNFKAVICFRCIACKHPEWAGIRLLAGLLGPLKTGPLKALECQLKWMFHRKASTALLSLWLMMSSQYQHTSISLCSSLSLTNYVEEHLSQIVESHTKKPTPTYIEKNVMIIEHSNIAATFTSKWCGFIKNIQFICVQAYIHISIHTCAI